MAVRDAGWPRRCSAADTVENRLRAVGDGVAAPGDVMVGADQYEIALIQRAGSTVADVDDLQGDAAVSCGGSQGVDVEVGEPQQREAQPE